MAFLFFLKWLLVLALLVAGTVFLTTGLGVQIPLVEYKGLTAHGVPSGIALLAFAIALAKFWKITTKTQKKYAGGIITESTETRTFFGQDTRH